MDKALVKAFIESLSFIGLVSVPCDISLTMTARIQFCCRFTRSKSPPGRLYRCRT